MPKVAYGDTGIVLDFPDAMSKDEIAGAIKANKQSLDDRAKSVSVAQAPQDNRPIYERDPNWVSRADTGTPIAYAPPATGSMAENIGAAMTNTVIDAASLFQRGQATLQSDPRLLFQSQSNQAADQLNRTANAIEQRQEVATGGAFLPRAVRGTIRSAVPTLASAAVGGAPAAILYGTGATGNQAVTQAADANIPEAAQTRYVATQTLAEAIPTILMGRMGWGGLESVFSGPVKQGFTNGLKRAGLIAAQELPEEYATAIIQAGSSALEGVDPNALDPMEFGKMMADVTAQTLMAGGLGAAASMAVAQPTPPSETNSPTQPTQPTPTEEATPEGVTDEEFRAAFAMEQGEAAPTPVEVNRTPFAPVEGQRLPSDTLTMPNEAGTPFAGIPAQPRQSTAAPTVEQAQPQPMQRPTSFGTTPRFTAQQVEMPAAESVPFGPQEDRRTSPVEALGRLIGVDMSQPTQAPDELVNTTIEAMSTPRQATKPVEVRAVDALYQIAQTKGDMTPTAMDESINDFLDEFDPSERRQALNVWAKLRDDVEAMTPEESDAWANLILGQQPTEAMAPVQQETTNEEVQGTRRQEEVAAPPRGRRAKQAPETPVEATSPPVEPEPVQPTPEAAQATPEPIPAPVEAKDIKPRGIGMRRATPEGRAMVEAAKQRLRDVINNPDIVGRQRNDMFENGKRLIQFFEANAANPENMDTGYERGDRVAYTGEQVEPGFRSFIYLEGANAGKEGVAVTPEQAAINLTKRQSEHRDQQEQFSRLNKATTPASTKRLPPPRKGSTSETGWSTVAKGVARKDVMGRTVEVVRQADGTWSVTRDEQEVDSGYKSRAEAEKYADGELTQDIRDQFNADSLEVETVEPQQLEQGIDVQAKESARNREGIRKEQIPPLADTGIFRDLTAAARAGQRFVEDLHVRIAPVLARIHAAAKSPVEFVRAAVAKIGEHIRPYARRFLQDVRKVNAEFAANPTRGSGPDPTKITQREVNREYRQGRREVERTIPAEKRMAAQEARTEERERGRTETGRLLDVARGREERRVVRETSRTAKEQYGVGRAAAEIAAKADMAAATARAKEEKEMSRAEAIATERERGAKREETAFLEGGKQTRRVLAGFRNPKELQDLTKRLREVAPPKLRALRERAVNRALSDTTIDPAKRERKLAGIVEAVRQDVMKYEGVEGARKAIAQTRKNLPSMEASLRKVAVDALNSINDGNPTKATIETSQQLLMGIVDGKQQESGTINPRALEKAQRTLDNFEAGRNLTTMNLDDVRRIRDFLERINDWHGAGLVEVKRRLEAKKAEAQEIAKELTANAKREIPGKEIASDSSAMQSIVNTTTSLNNIVGALGPDGSLIKKALSDELDRGEALESQVKHEANLHMLNGLTKLGLLKSKGKGTYEATKELMEMSPLVSGTAARGGFIRGLAEKLGAIKSQYQNFGDLRLSTAQRIKLYNLARDPWARYQLVKGKGAEVWNPLKKEFGRINNDILNDVVDSLTAKERGVADLMFQHNNGRLREQMNKAWREVYGHDIFHETDHESLRRFMDGKDPDSMGQKITGSYTQDYGIFKSREGGNEPIILDDAFAEFFSHVNKVAAAVGKMDVTMQARRVLGTKEFTQALRKAHPRGGAILKELEQRIKQYGEVRAKGVDALESGAKTMLRNLGSTMVAQSVPALVTAPLSITAARSVIPLKHLVANMRPTFSDRDFKEIEENSPWLYQVITDTGQQVTSPESAGVGVQRFYGNQKNTIAERVAGTTRWLNGQVAYALWRAAKDEGKARGLTGDALMEFANQQSRKAYGRSQPDNSFVNQSGAKLKARDSTAWSAYTFLEGQTQKAWNQVVEARNRYRWSKGTAADKAEYAQDVAFAMVIPTLQYTTASYVYKAVMAELFDDDEKREEMEKDLGWDFTADNIVNAISTMPAIGKFAGTGARMLYNGLTGKPLWAGEITPFGRLFNDTMKVIYNSGKALSEGIDDRQKLNDGIVKPLLSLLQATGLPSRPVGAILDMDL